MVNGERGTLSVYRFTYVVNVDKKSTELVNPAKAGQVFYFCLLLIHCFIDSTNLWILLKPDMLSLLQWIIYFLFSYSPFYWKSELFTLPPLIPPARGEIFIV